jgi:hypothetical protein
MQCSMPTSRHLSRYGRSDHEWADWTIQIFIEGAQECKQLKVHRLALKMDRLYSTTSFQSEIPLPYFSYAEYNIHSPVIDFVKAKKGTLFLARNCNSKSGREDGVKSLQKSPFRVDSRSKCLHNADPPPEVSLSSKTQLYQSYLFV